MNITSETTFKTAIRESLIESGGYIRGMATINTFYYHMYLKLFAGKAFRIRVKKVKILPKRYHFRQCLSQYTAVP